MHLGGFLVIHPDNTCEINLMDACDKNQISPEKFTQSDFEKYDGNVYADKI